MKDQIEGLTLLLEEIEVQIPLVATMDQVTAFLKVMVSVKNITKDIAI